MKPSARMHAQFIQIPHDISIDQKWGGTIIRKHCDTFSWCPILKSLVILTLQMPSKSTWLSISFVLNCK